jgi:RNA polymerase sigma factor (sigma-70 family)
MEYYETSATPTKGVIRPGGDAPLQELFGEVKHADIGETEVWLTAARPRLRRLAQRRGVPPDAVEDVVQETLLEAWTHLDRLHTSEGRSLWLDAICRNVCRRHARKHFLDWQHMSPLLIPRRSNDGASEEMATSFPDQFPDTSASDPLEAISRQDLALLLDRALGLLSRDARQVVELCYLLELPQREVALRLGLTLSALEARLHRTRRQLRQVLNGPLRAEAEALDVTLDEEIAGGWRETRLWCTLCGRRRLMGHFLPQPDGGSNLHMRCPDCERDNGLSDVHNSNVHSKGLVRLDGLQSFRPAWKRTMQGMTLRLTRTLLADEHPCPHCGAHASSQVLEKRQFGEGELLPAGLARHPYQFWVWWQCPRGHHGSNTGLSVFAASDLVYWSHARTQQFMREHPRWVSGPELLVDFAGCPAIRFQMADVVSAARLTVLAHCQTLEILATF